MASAAVAHVPKIHDPRKKSSGGPAIYKVDLPLSPDSSRDAKATGQIAAAQLVDEQKNIIGPSSEESCASSSNGHSSLLFTPFVPFPEPSSEPGHHPLTVPTQSSSPPTQFPLRNNEAASQVTGDSSFPPALRHDALPSVSRELVDDPPIGLVSPPPLPPKSPARKKRSLPSFSHGASNLQSQGTPHIASSNSYQYSASEPGHTDLSSCVSSSRTRKFFSIRLRHQQNKSVIHERKEPALRMSSANGESRKTTYASVGAEASSAASRYSAGPPAIAYPVSFPAPMPPANEDATTPLQSPSGNARTRNKLRKTPPSNHPPSEHSSRHMSLSAMTRPQSMFASDMSIPDLTHSRPAAFASSSSENARFFAQSHAVTSPIATSSRRPAVPQYPSVDTSASCTSGSNSGSAEDSLLSALSTSTAPTSPSIASDSAHKSGYYYLQPGSESLSNGLPFNQYPSPSGCGSAGHLFTQSPVPFNPAPVYSSSSPKSTNICFPSQSHAITPPAARKLTKKRPPPPAHASASVPPPSRSAREARYIEIGHAHAVDGQHHHKRSKSILGVRIGSGHGHKEREKEKEKYGRSHERDGSSFRNERDSMHSSMWAVPEGEKMHVPDPCRPNGSIASKRRPRDAASTSSANVDRTSRALSDLAFTGTTSALSSTALAALTSRLNGNEYSPERLTTSFDPLAANSYPSCPGPYADEPYSDIGRVSSTASIDGVRRGRKSKSELGHVQAYAHEAFSKVHPSRSNSISFLNQDPYPQAYPRPRTSSSSMSAHHSPHLRPQSQTHEIPMASLDQRRKEVGRVENDCVSSMRRWTLAMTDVSDEVLVQELERLRKEGMKGGRGRTRKLSSNTNASCSEHGVIAARENKVGSRSKRASGCDFIYGGPVLPAPTSISTHGGSLIKSKNAQFLVGEEDEHDSDECESEEALSDDEFEEAEGDSDDSDWKIARRALLCCRELVLTERTYQFQLRTLLSGDIAPTSQHPRVPALVLSYLPALLSASEAFLARLEDDPSAWGVSAAWLGCEEELESAFVGWCGVVGELFVDREATIRVDGKKLSKKTSGVTSPRASMEVLSASVSGFARSRSGVNMASSSNARPATKERQRASSYIGSKSTGHDGPAPSPPVMTTSSSQGSGMFTAALGTGLPFGLALSPGTSTTTTPQHQYASPFSSPAVDGPPVATRSRSDSGNSSPSPLTPLTPRSFFSNQNQPSFQGQTKVDKAQNGGSESLTRSFTAALRKKSLLSSSAMSLPIGLLGSEKDRERERERVRMKKERKIQERREREKEKKASVRELAIQPTQRIMRYVLQYRDLLQHTPASSPSRALVERALESAVRIAQKCDRAQGNSAFLHR